MFISMVCYEKVDDLAGHIDLRGGGYGLGRRQGV